MKNQPGEWKSVGFGCTLIVAGFVQLLASYRISPDYLVVTHSIGLLICLFGSRFLLASGPSWVRILGGGLVCGIVHGIWGFLFTMHPPEGAPPNYFRGVEGALMMFGMWSIFTGGIATVASAFVEVFALELKRPKRS